MSRPNVGDRIPIGAVGDAETEHVLEGKTFSSEPAGVGVAGEMPNIGAENITPGVSSQNISKGYHNGQGEVASLGGNAEASHVREDKTFSSNSAGREKSGSMTNRGAHNITPETSPQSIPEGYHNGQGEVASLGGNAAKSDVLTGKTFSSDNEGRAASGNMTDRGTHNITPGTSNIVIPSGRHSGSGVVYSLGGNAEAGDVLSGKSFSSNNEGRNISGSMPNRGSENVTPGTSEQNFPSGYYSGITVQGDNDLQAENIKDGVSIFGVTGVIPGAAYPSNTLRISADEERSHDGVHYLKVKEIQIGITGAVRITFDIKVEGGSNKWGYAKVRRDGYEVEDFSTATSSYSERTCDDFFRAGDKAQLWICTNGTDFEVFIKNFRIRYDIDFNKEDEEVLLN